MSRPYKVTVTISNDMPNGEGESLPQQNHILEDFSDDDETHMQKVRELDAAVSVAVYGVMDKFYNKWKESKGGGKKK